MKKYDLIIIGSGPAGYTAAFAAAGRGMKTAIVEKNINNLGGVCLNEGCIPLKGLLHYSGFNKDYNEIIKTVMQRVELIKSGLKSRIQQKTDIIEGKAVFISPDEIKANDETIKSKFFLIAAGSSPKKIFKNENVHTSEKIFNMQSLPQKVLIIGGGVIGCEYASFLNNTGAKVEIAEIMETLLYGEDPEAVRTLHREFKKKGIKVHCGIEITGIDKENQVTIKTSSGEIKEKYDMIFETTGRKPGTEDLGLDCADVNVNDRGFIIADQNMQTSNKKIYAAGDCIETPMLAYTAYREAEQAVRHMVNEPSDIIDYSMIPVLVFSMPQLGSIGTKEDDLKRKKINYNTYKYFFKAIGKAAIEGKDSGFLKLIADEDDRHIIGASAVGEEIVDIINELTIIIKNRIPIKEVKECLHIHPSYSEIIIEALNYGRI